MKTFLDGRVILHHGDNREVLKGVSDNSIDSVVTDPPYALVSIVKRFGGANAAPAKHGKDGAYARASRGFMGKQWDTGEVAFSEEFWVEVLRVLKPGGHVAAFGSSRGYHRMACAIEDAGFEIRDSLMWLYGTGFPKSHDVSKGIDKQAGVAREVVGSKLDLPGYHLNGHDGGEAFGHGLSSTTYETRLKSSQITAPATDAARQWQGWGTALKPAFEPIVLARKPLSESTVAANVLRWGTGALNIGATRVGMEVRHNAPVGNANNPDTATGPAKKGGFGMRADTEGTVAIGRWPANVVHDGSGEVVEAFPNTKGQQGAVNGDEPSAASNGSITHKRNRVASAPPRGDSGSAARFFYSAKASKTDRAGSKHPTVKPVSLKRYLQRLLTPPGGVSLDPFAGSGTSGEAAYLEGFRSILIEREDEYVADITRRLESIAAPEHANDNQPQLGMFNAA